MVHRPLVVVVLLLALAACGDDEATPNDAPVPTAPLIVTVDGSGAGTVTSSPSGIDCGADCFEEFAVGTTVTLTATPTGSASFMGWSGGGCSGAGPCTITAGAQAAVTATFTANDTLDVTVDGTGAGAVTSTPSGIDCGADCSATFPRGTLVALTATADATSTFTGWSGVCSGTATCGVTVDQPRTVDATFTRNRYALRVTLAGTGSGTVISTTAGINCGGDCTEIYDHGTVVTLTATAAAGSRFTGWSGSCSGTADCTVTMNAITSVTATFDVGILTVTRAGGGTGMVTSSPAGISCDPDCSETYPIGTAVTLTAFPGPGATFATWSGACSGTGPCTVTVDGPIAVTAHFSLAPTHALTVNVVGDGRGIVSSSPSGIACSSGVCMAFFAAGTAVTLTANTIGFSRFGGWSGGGCSGTDPTCVVVMDGSKTVTATFNFQ